MIPVFRGGAAESSGVRSVFRGVLQQNKGPAGCWTLVLFNTCAIALDVLGQKLEIRGRGLKRRR